MLFVDKFLPRLSGKRALFESKILRRLVEVTAARSFRLHCPDLLPGADNLGVCTVGVLRRAERAGEVALNIEGAPAGRCGLLACGCDGRVDAGPALRRAGLHFRPLRRALRGVERR